MKKRLRIIISLMLCAFLTSSCANTSTGAAQPAAEQPVAEQQTAAQPAAEQQTAAQPAAEQQTAAQPAAEHPAAEQQTAEQPATEQPATAQLAAEQKTPDQATYTYTEYSLERNDIPLHLDCMKVDGTEPKDNILLMHGSTYSSHEFDINYEDYSLVRRLAREGYAVWRMDVAGLSGGYPGGINSRKGGYR